MSYPAWSVFPPRSGRWLLLLLVSVFGANAATVSLVSRGDPWRHRGGTNPPQANWQSIPDADLDSTWLTNAGGFGYGDPGIVGEAFTISGMVNVHRTYAIRRTFNIGAPPDTNMHLRLTADFDDGFAAWLDGVLIASNNAPSGLGWNTSATAGREASCCNSPNPPLSIPLGAVLDRLPPGDHTLAILGFNQNLTSSDFHMIFDLDLVDAPVIPPGVVPVSGTIGANTTWYRTNTYQVIGNLTVASGVTLTIEPGVSVIIDPGLNIAVNGRLLAEGDPTNRIRFTRSGASNWGALDLNASATTNRLRFVDFSYSSGNLDATDTTVYLENLAFSNTTAQLIDLIRSSVTLLDTFIPAVPVELIHFSDMPPNGHALIKNCVFSQPVGYNDNVDFTGGNRPGPIVQFIENVFLSGVDDCFDMDVTDAHIEGNIFMNVLQDDERDSSSNPITTGDGNASLASELVVCRNIFYNCEHSLLLKDFGAAVMQNNTIVRLVTNVFARTAAPPGGQPIPPGIILFGEPWRSGRTPGAGAIYEGNIAYDLHPVIQANPFPLFSAADSFLIARQNIIQGNLWPGPGNMTNDPMFVNIAGPMTYQNIRSNLSLLAGSPATGTGPNGLDMGALVPAGASISGEPMGTTTNTSALLRVAGPGIYAYRWKLNDGPWSAEVPLTNSIAITSNLFANAQPIALTNLTNGTYTVRVIGKNSAGFWQSTNEPAVSKTWTVGIPVPRIESVERTGATVTLTFIAQAGQTYSVLRSDTLNPPDWTWLLDAGPVGVTGLIPVTDTNATPVTRFYRLVTPAQPPGGP